MPEALICMGEKAYDEILVETWKIQKAGIKNFEGVV